MLVVCENCVTLVVMCWRDVTECALITSDVRENTADRGDVEYAVWLVPWYCTVNLGVSAVDNVSSDCILNIDVAET